MVEKCFAPSGASSVSDLRNQSEIEKSETDEAPERAKRFSTIPFPSLSGCSEKKKRKKTRKAFVALTALKHRKAS